MTDKHSLSQWDIPKDKSYPTDAAQCNGCGGLGCHVCQDLGWVLKDSPHARRCEREECGKLIPPDQWAIYCSNECANLDVFP